METPHAPRRLLAGIITVSLLGLVVGLVAWFGRNPDSNEAQAKEEAVKAVLSRAWPLFGGTPGRNMVNTVDKDVPTEWDVGSGKNIKWSALLGSRAYGGPVIAGGKVFVGTNNEAPRDPKYTRVFKSEDGKENRMPVDMGVLMCFKESNGEFLWQAAHEKLASGQVNDWPKEGICATPLVEDGKVYYVNNRCEVVCADVEGVPAKKDAKYLWVYDMMKELNVFPHNMSACSPVIAGDLVFIVTANGVDEEHIKIPSPTAPSFIALNKKTGKLVWKDSSPGNNIMHGQWSNASLAVVNGKPQIIFPGGDGWLRAFDPQTGKEVWKFDANPKDSKYELGGMGTKSDFIATPVVVGDRCYIGTGQDPEHYEGVAHFWCIDITKTGDLSPELVTDAKADPPKSKPNPNSAAVWHFGGPVKPADRNKFKRDYYFGRTMSTAAVHDGLVYIGELAGYLHCLDAKTGKKYWDHDMKAGVWGSPYWVDGKVMIATEEGDVYIFEHGKEKKAPKKVEMEQPVRSTPVVVNGVLYVMTERQLFAIGKK